MARQLYFDSGGVLTKDRTMTMAYGKAYGGSTVVYTGTSLTIPEEVVTRWDVPGIEYADLQRRSAKYLDENNVHKLDESELNDNNRLFRAGCQKLGYRVAAVSHQRQRVLGRRACAIWAAPTAPSRAPTGSSCRRRRLLGSR